MVTSLPTGPVEELQPSVSVTSPVPAQWAACPRNTRSPAVNTKLAVQLPPPAVSVTTPGCSPARPAGAHPVTTGDPATAGTAGGAARAARGASAPRPTTTAMAADATVPRAPMTMYLLLPQRPNRSGQRLRCRVDTLARRAGNRRRAPGVDGSDAPRVRAAPLCPPRSAQRRRSRASRPLPWWDRGSSPYSGGTPPEDLVREVGRPRPKLHGPQAPAPQPTDLDPRRDPGLLHVQRAVRRHARLQAGAHLGRAHADREWERPRGADRRQGTAPPADVEPACRRQHADHHPVPDRLQLADPHGAAAGSEQARVQHHRAPGVVPGHDADLPHPARPGAAHPVLDDEQRPGWREPRDELRQVAREAAQQGHAEDDVRRRGGRRRGGRRAVRDQGLPAEP